MVVTFPPDSDFNPDTFDPAKADAELKSKMPGFAETFETDNPGMHRTPTIDYGIILEGEITLELDDGENRQVMTGDIVVQNSTRHAWRNHSDKPCKVAFIMVGTPKSSNDY